MKNFLKIFKLMMLCFVTLLNSSITYGLPTVGRKAAGKYFAKSGEGHESDGGGVLEKTSVSEHHMDISIGKFLNSQAYEWGQHDKQENLGDWSANVTYRIGEWKNSMDLNIRIDYQEFKVLGQRVNKLSFLPLITFPDAQSQFPLYFGAGIGFGVFLNQLQQESTLSLDYQLVLGARFFNVSQNTGFFIESGLKNHLSILTSGQFNSTFFALGTVFTF